jgi:hypothetical protein
MTNYLPGTTANSNMCCNMCNVQQKQIWHKDTHISSFSQYQDAYPSVKSRSAMVFSWFIFSLAYHQKSSGYKETTTDSVSMSQATPCASLKDANKPKSRNITIKYDAIGHTACYRTQGSTSSEHCHLRPAPSCFVQTASDIFLFRP